MSKLELSGIRKSFGSVEVIHGVDMQVADGEFMVFVGPSGCGKSTMLRMIAGLEDITEGTLTINGSVMNDETPVKRGISMVFQSYSLYPNMTVRQNMEFGLKQARTPKPEIKRLVDEAAEILKLESVMNRRPSQLSGGQSQRVAIGRSIVRNPGIFLFDEPLSNLDAELRVHMRVELKALHERLGRTMIYVTHDQVEAMTMADRIAVFHDGVIEQVGTPLELYNAPANLFVARFIGSPKMNIFPATRTDKASADLFGANVSIPDNVQGDSKNVLLGARPEHIEITEAEDATVTGELERMEQLGGEAFVYVRIKGLDDAVIVRAPGQLTYKTRQSMGLRIPTDRMYVLDAGTEKAINRLVAP